MITRYDIQTANAATPDEALMELRVRVNNTLASVPVWQPYGDVAIIANANGTFTAAQAMVRGEG